MTDHDPLCQASLNGNDDIYFCVCEFIAKVVAREQERHGNNCRGMWDEWTHDLRAQVETLPIYHSGTRMQYVLRESVLRVIDRSSDA